MWRKELDSGKIVAAAFVDFKKAFNCVNNNNNIKIYSAQIP